MKGPKYSIIPKPQRYDIIDGSFTITSETAILCVPEFIKAGNYLSSFLKTKKDAKNGAIKFNKDEKIRKEGYKLKVNSEGVTITASDENGAFYGAVTLKIMIMQSKQSNGVAVVNGAYIYDYPKYEFRSGMMDESRHFFGMDAVKRALDSFAMVKLNKFHWHLSDDQGYRIESEAFPLLNEIGSKRQYEYLGGAEVFARLGLKKDGDEYFHYYKKDEIREIVEYAKNLCIDVIPEIDIPGHTTAFLAAYNELSCLKGDYEVHCENGVTKDVLCVSQEKTYEFVEILLKEVLELFPYKYFHIGGDEAVKGHKIWENDCPSCKKAIEENNLKNGAQLQEMFINRVNKMLNEMGKVCIEWNDGVGENTDGNIVCQYWIYRTPLWIKKQSEMRKFIVSPCPTMYFDFTYSRSPLKKVYNYNVVKSGFVNEKSVLGVEFESWSEWIVNEETWQFAVYPRIFALAEVAWTEDNIKNYKDFYKRLEFFKAYMRAKGINYSRLEKKKLGVKNKSGYHLGHLGPEYKFNEKLKENETK